MTIDMLIPLEERSDKFVGTAAFSPPESSQCSCLDYCCKKSAGPCYLPDRIDRSQQHQMMLRPEISEVPVNFQVLPAHPCLSNLSCSKSSQPLPLRSCRENSQIEFPCACTTNTLLPMKKPFCTVCESLQDRVISNDVGEQDSKNTSRCLSDAGLYADTTNQYFTADCGLLNPPSHLNTVGREVVKKDVCDNTELSHKLAQHPIPVFPLFESSETHKKDQAGQAQPSGVQPSLLVCRGISSTSLTSYGAQSHQELCSQHRQVNNGLTSRSYFPSSPAKDLNGLEVELSTPASSCRQSNVDKQIDNCGHGLLEQSYNTTLSFDCVESRQVKDSASSSVTSPYQHTISICSATTDFYRRRPPIDILSPAISQYSQTGSRSGINSPALQVCCLRNLPSQDARSCIDSPRKVVLLASTNNHKQNRHWPPLRNCLDTNSLTPSSRFCNEERHRRVHESYERVCDDTSLDSLSACHSQRYDHSTLSQSSLQPENKHVCKISSRMGPSVSGEEDRCVWNGERSCNSMTACNSHKLSCFCELCLLNREGRQGDDGSHIGDCLSPSGSVDFPSELPVTLPVQNSVIRGYIPANPYGLSKGMKALLQFTELPFLILWVYFAYFVVIVVLAAPHVRTLVWLNALVAGLLVGMGLNANAYNAIMYKGKADIGMVVRFFLIPFGVSALSGLTNSLREQFMLVFPKDPMDLTVAVVSPALLVSFLLVTRVLFLYINRVPANARNILLNGKIYQ